MFSLQSDIQALDVKLIELGNVAAVVIDPISAYLGSVDSHKNADVRSALAPLSDLAAHHNVAIILVSHLSKAASTSVLMRVTGSLAFVATARAAWLVAADPEDDMRRVFVPMKNNIGPDGSGLAYRIEAVTIGSSAGPIETSRIKWESEAFTGRADEVMDTGNNSKVSALEAAKTWLKNLLEGGPMGTNEVFERAAEDGLKEATVRRAKGALQIRATKTEFSGGWEWALPPQDDQWLRRCP